MKAPSIMMKMTPELSNALGDGLPTVALESTLICHGIPKPENAELAVQMERCVRLEGAHPATMAVIDGVVRIGLGADELQRLAAADDVAKCTTRDLPLVMAKAGIGATTVASTIYLAARHGIGVMATGGLGGVHLGGEQSLDVSADLYELQRSAVTVVCAGIKSILDQARTMEVLESLGVPVIGYRCRELPAFYTTESGIEIAGVDELDDLVRIIQCHQTLKLPGGMLVVTPPPSEFALSGSETSALVENAGKAAEQAGIRGPAQTPFMLRHMADASHGRTVALNMQLATANATLAARIAARLHSAS
jgi:pseudouridine-5'-phosphate glycosidase